MIPKPTFAEEMKLWEKGVISVIGLDEVGRGAFAGPVVVAAVVYPHQFRLEPHSELRFVHDSKLLSSKKREKLAPIIQNNCLYWSIAQMSVTVINRVGIGDATFMAFRKVLKQIQAKILNDSLFALIDGFHIKFVPKLGLKQQKAIIKGDQKSISIASASILAKVYRDKLMGELHNKYSHYGFLENKGYGTLSHRLALKKYGLSPHHRTSFNLQKFLS